MFEDCIYSRLIPELLQFYYAFTVTISKAHSPGETLGVIRVQGFNRVLVEGLAYSAQVTYGQTHIFLVAAHGAAGYLSDHPVSA